jgi:hypothetical protein
MSQLLTLDLVELESNLKNEVNSFFKKAIWDIKPYLVEKDWRSWNKMMGTGKTAKASSTRRCLDSKRYFNSIIGDRTKIGVTL